MKNTFLTCLLSLFTITAYGESLDVDLSNDSFRAQFNLFDRRQPLGFSGSFMLVEEVGDIYSLNLRTQAQLDGRKNIRGGFGGRLYYVSPEIDGVDSFQSLALGGFLDIKIPELRGVIVGAEVYFAPSVTTSNGFGNFREMMFKVRYHLYENADIYLGARYIDVSADNSSTDFDLDNNLHIGFTLRF